MCTTNHLLTGLDLSKKETGILSSDYQGHHSIPNSAIYLMCGNILNPAGPQLVHGDEAGLGADGNPSSGQAVGDLQEISYADIPVNGRRN
jgi:hypothetical protein